MQRDGDEKRPDVCESETSKYEVDVITIGSENTTENHTPIPIPTMIITDMISALKNVPPLSIERDLTSSRLCRG